jgi:hypothetical protein
LVFWFFGLCVDGPDLAHGSELFFLPWHICNGFPHTNQKTKKTKNQKTKKPKNQKTKKTKKTKKTRPNTLHLTPSPWGVQSWFFCFFLVFCFFGFLVWIAIADVPSRDCQALSVVALEARSIHYSTAMFAMT